MHKITYFLKYIFLFKLSIINRIFIKMKGRSSRIERIVVIQLAKLGDMVCTTPMFHAIKKDYPRIELIVIGNKINKELLSGNTDIDEYIVFDNFSSVLKQLRSRKIDVGIVVTPGFLQLGLLCISGIPQVITPRVVERKSPYENSFYKMLSRFVVRVPHDFFGYAPREYLRLLEPLKIESLDTQKHLAFSDEAKQKVEGFLSQYSDGMKQLVIISPSAGNKIKQWPAERFALLAEKIRDDFGALVVVIGTERDQKEVEEMFSVLKNSNDIVNAISKFSVDELKALIAKAGLFIGVDTGPMYIAEAFGVSTVDIIGPVDERVQPPRGEKNVVVYDKNRREAELFIMDARTFDPAEARRQVEVISAEEVLSACKKLLM